MKSTRRQIITDQTVQGELLFRSILYWLFCLCTVFLSVMAWAMWSQPGVPFLEVAQQSLVVSAPVFVGAILLLPLILIDVLRVSNRFVGPIRQVRHVLKQLAHGEPSRRVYLRKDDFWQDLAHYTNIVAEDLEQSREPDLQQETDEHAEPMSTADAEPVKPR